MPLAGGKHFASTMRRSRFETGGLYELASGWTHAYNASALQQDLNAFGADSRPGKLLVDPGFGFEFLLESLTITPNASVVLLVTEPSKLIERLRTARDGEASIRGTAKGSRKVKTGSSLCDASGPLSARLASTKLNAKRAVLKQTWISAFGSSCPSDFQAIKVRVGACSVLHSPPPPPNQTTHDSSFPPGLSPSQYCRQAGESRANHRSGFRFGDRLANAVQPTGTREAPTAPIAFYCEL